MRQQRADRPSRRLAGRSASSPFFWARLLPPPTTRHYVRRQRLLDLLDDAARAPLTLIVAPAGAGKTSLLSDWCAGRPAGSTGWVSLDPVDRSTGQFWAAMSAVVGDLLPEHLGDHEEESGLGRTPDDVLDAFAALEPDHPDGVVVVIDDLHLIDDEPTLATSLEQFLQCIPDWVHIVLSSRRVPHLPVDRLRARGHLAEVLFDELRFSDAESIEMVTRLAPWMARWEAAATAKRASGWAAGLQLSGLAARAARAQGHAASTAGRSDLMVSDYIWHEVLAQERPELIEALLDVSVVKRATFALAAALTDREDAADLLLEAEARGLFVGRLGAGDLVEIHSLVRDVLLKEATRRDPDRVRDRHARAARWFETRAEVGDVALALEHWLAAEEPRAALRLLAAHVTELYDLGLERTISTTLARIPTAVTHVDVDAEIDLAWCELLVDRSRFLEDVRDAAAMIDPAHSPSTTRGRVRMLESIAATVTGHWSEGGQQALEAMQLLGPASWADPWGRFGWNMVARDLALSESWDDQAAPLRDARSALGRDPERRLSYEGIRALGSALAGSPLEALRIAAGVSDYARVKSMTILRLEIATAEALAHRELGDRDRAREELRAVAEAQAGPVSPARALALLGLVQICLDEADLDGAGACLAVAETYIRTELPGPDAATWLARQAFLVALAAGDLASAARRNERVEDKFWHGIGLARLHLHRGEHADAAAQLSAVAPRCPGHEVTRDLLLARTMPRGPESVEVYGAAVQRAVALGLMQTVASEGAVILDLLERHPWLAPEPWVAKVRRAAPPSPRTAMARLTLPGEHLTERELGVLRMLPSRLTLREIADELGISVNTVKFHLRVIYRKLGVGSRAEASALARGLVSLGHDERR